MSNLWKLYSNHDVIWFIYEEYWKDFSKQEGNDWVYETCMLFYVFISYFYKIGCFFLQVLSPKRFNKIFEKWYFFLSWAKYFSALPFNRYLYNIISLDV